MVEVGHLKFPRSIKELPSLVTFRNLKILLAINDAFWRLCRPSKEPELINARYTKTPDFITYFIEGSKEQNLLSHCLNNFSSTVPAHIAIQTPF